MKFVKKYWSFVFLFLLALAVFLNASAFQVLGTILYVPVLTFGGILLAVAFRAVFNRDTTWPYVRDNDESKGYDADFRNLPPNQRVWFAGIQFWVYLIFVALVILAAMG